MTMAAPYDWEAAYHADPRRQTIQAALDRIMATSFPSVAARLERLERVPTDKQQSAVKPEPIPTAREPARLELDAAVYLTESSSDVDSQVEVDPKEALKEMEAQAARRDVAMADADDDHQDDDDDDDTACVVCHKSDNEKQILLCDECNAEYHLYCLRPPLTAVPPGDWFCPPCAVSRVPTPAEPEAMDVDDEALSDAVIRIKQETAKAKHAEPNTATSVSIAQTFETDIAKSNDLLVHACNCETPRCADATFREFCPLMKRFLRSACWASHNENWLTYRIATATAELLAYHSLHCNADRAQCSVPLCNELRVEEYV